MYNYYLMLQQLANDYLCFCKLHKSMPLYCVFSGGIGADLAPDNVGSEGQHLAFVCTAC